MGTALHEFLALMKANREGLGKGIYSVCSAHPDVLEACFQQAKADRSVLLIESTSNQVNQFGGYTGMCPADFVRYVGTIAEKTRFPMDNVLMGGDHLGPNPWKNLPSEEAMDMAKMLVSEYVKAGYQKIHLDSSMYCADDEGDRKKPLSDKLVAQRASVLCRVAEETWKKCGSNNHPPVYVIGTEVPVPGGAQDEEDGIISTTPQDVERTISITQECFKKAGLSGAWERVIGLVVQPGVEFGDDRIIHFEPEKAGALSKKIIEFDRLVFEAHSTDYQTEEHLRELVKGHFCILKVGPWLTFAYREALFALKAIETEVMGKRHANLSRLGETLEKAMMKEQKYWRPYYHGDRRQLAFKRKYSFSDRSRYYWNVPEVEAEKNKLFDNLKKDEIPLSLLSQFMPEEFYLVCGGKTRPTPVELVQSHIRRVVGKYSRACGLSGCVR